MVLHSCFGNRKSGSIPTFSTMPLQDAASVHVVALLSSIVLGITRNCPLGYSAIAKRLRQWSLTPSLVCSNHTRAAKAHNGRSCKSSYKVAVKQLCGEPNTIELLPHFLWNLCLTTTLFYGNIVSENKRRNMK